MDDGISWQVLDFVLGFPAATVLAKRGLHATVAGGSDD
jgi:hypothetical protein